MGEIFYIESLEEISNFNRFAFIKKEVTEDEKNQFIDNIKM